MYISVALPPTSDTAPSPRPETHVPSGKPSPYEDIEISNIRAVIAKRLGEAKVRYYVILSRKI